MKPNLFIRLLQGIVTASIMLTVYVPISWLWFQILPNEPSVYLNVCNGDKTLCFPVVYVNSPFKKSDRCINFDDQQVYYRFCDDYSFEYGGTVEDFEKRIKEQRMK